jgi:hypothetical protein
VEKALIRASLAAVFAELKSEAVPTRFHPADNAFVGGVVLMVLTDNLATWASDELIRMPSKGKTVLVETNWLQAWVEALNR